MEAFLARKYRTVIKSLGLRSSRHAATDTDTDTEITDTDRQVLIVDRSRSSLSDTVDSTDVRRRIMRRLTPASVSRCRSVTEQTSSRCDGRGALQGVLSGALNAQLRRPRRRRPRSDVDQPPSRVVTRCASTPELMSVVASAHYCHHQLQMQQQRRKSVDVVWQRVCARPEPEAAGIVTSERNVASSGGTIRKRLERLRQRVFTRKSSTSTTKTSSTEHSYCFNVDEQRQSTEELSPGRPSHNVIAGQITIQRKSASSRDRLPPSSSSSCSTLSSTRSRDSPPDRLTFLHEKSYVRRAASSVVHDSTRLVLQRTLNVDGSCGSRLVDSDVTAEQRRRSASLVDVTAADASVIGDVTATRVQRTCFPVADGLPRDQLRTSRDSSRTRTHQLQREQEDSSNSSNSRCRHLIVLDRGEGGRQKLGFTVVGGRDTPRGPMGVYVKTVFVGGLAAEPGGLQQGDEIESVNELPLCGLSHQDAVDVFKQCRRGRVCLVVKRRENSTNSDISSQLTAARATTTVTNDYRSTRNVSLQVPTEPRFLKDRHFPAVIRLPTSTTSTCDVTSYSASPQDQRETSSLSSVNDIASQSEILPSVLPPRSSDVATCGTTQTAADTPRRPQRRRTQKLKLSSSCEQLTFDAEQLQKRDERKSETDNVSFSGLETSDSRRQRIIQNMNSASETNKNLFVTVRSTSTTLAVITFGNHRQVEIFPLLLKPRFTVFDHCALAFHPSSLADVFAYSSTLEMFGTIVFTDYSDTALPEVVSSIGNEARAIGLISATSDINNEQVQSLSSSGEDDLTVTSYYRLISNNKNVNCRREYRLRSAKHFSSNFSSEFSTDWNRAEPEIANGDVMHRTSTAAVDRNLVISHWRRPEPEILLHAHRRRRSVLV